MADESLVSLLRQGVSAWNEWRRKHIPTVVEPDLSEANLRHANLSEADLRQANPWDRLA